MAQPKYPHLHLTDWPFRTVPDSESCSFMADRTRLATEIGTLLTHLSRRPSSTMHLMWAWFGAGKTHALKHIEHLCKTEFNTIVPIYVEFPKSTKNFLDIYRAFFSAIDLEILNNAYEHVFSSPAKDNIEKELQFAFPDLWLALRLLYQGNPSERESIVRWLRTECRDRADLKAIGVARPVDRAEDATKVMSWLARLISEWEGIPENKRVLLMLDEYQRIEKLRLPARDEINGCLYSVFNRCPNGLSIMVSFSGYPEQRRLPPWLSVEIKDRIGIEKPLLLPPLLREEVLAFVRDVLSHFRSQSPDSHGDYFPFTYEAVVRVMETMEEKAKKAKREDQPKPRTIMQFFGAVLQEADSLIEEGKMEVIDTGFVDEVLKDVNLLEEE